MSAEYPELWDRDRAIANMAHDSGVADQLFSMLVDSLDGVVAGLQEQFERRDWEALWQGAHKLKGGSRLCCATRLEQLSEALETSARARDGDTVRALLAALGEQRERLQHLRPVT